MIAGLQQPEHTEARRVKHGFTLVELVVAVAVTGIILLGMGSSMMIASRAMPDARSRTATTLAAGEAVEQIVTDLQYAVSVSQRSANMIEFSVADRNGDDVPETIRYAWSGAPGTPLTRQYNGGTLVNILTDVQQFSLTHNLKTISTQIPQGTEGVETTLATYSATKNLYDYPISGTEEYAEYFFPSLPVGALSWRVTRLIIKAKLDGATDGQASVQLQLPTIGKWPSGAVLEEKTLLESTLLTNYGDREFTFSAAGGLSPSRGLCLVVKWVANGTACRVRGCSSGVTATNLSLGKSTNRGASWSTLASQSLLFTVYGTVTSAGTPQTQTTNYLEGVDITLRATSDSQSIVQTGVRLLNRPEVTP